MSGASEIKAAFMNSKRLGEFQVHQDHPFKPERGLWVYQMCNERGLFSDPRVTVVEVEDADYQLLERFHTPEYIEALKRANSGTEVDLEMLHHGVGSAENPIFKGVYEFAALSTTATVEAARLVADGVESAFNPCGGWHHAFPDRASGFCYVNDMTIAINELRESGLRVACVDIDAHHGDALQAAYYADPTVLTISTHETGKTLFPWSGFEYEMGKGRGKGFNVNVPLEPYSDDEVFLLLFREIVMEALRIFEPDIIVGQFGSDALSTDPLTHLLLSNNGYIRAIKMLHKSFPRIVALGGGGYNKSNVVKCLTLLWEELAGLKPEEGYGGALGGVFLGDASIQGADLRDMPVVTSGTEKDQAMACADQLIAHFKKEIKPLLIGA